MQQKKHWHSVLAELRDLCAAQCTGTLFLRIPGNHLAQIGLVQGEIVALAYDSKYGAEALTRMQQIPEGYTRFEPKTLLAAKTPLASTAELLALLDVSNANVLHTPAPHGMPGTSRSGANEPRVQTGLSRPVGHETEASATARRAAVCQCISEVTNRLIEAFGDQGFGRDNLLKVIAHRLRRLQATYPFLTQVELRAGQIDFTPLVSASATAESMAQAWGLLIQEIRQSALDNLGRNTAQRHYEKIFISYNAQSQKVWEEVGVSNPLPQV